MTYCISPSVAARSSAVRDRELYKQLTCYRLPRVQLLILFPLNAVVSVAPACSRLAEEGANHSDTKSPNAEVLASGPGWNVGLTRLTSRFICHDLSESHPLCFCVV